MVTVAVVSFNTRALLLDCLASLAPQVETSRAEVWVVDNASADGSAAAARQAAPWATVVEAAQNLGFGAAVNLVAERTRSPWLLAANADIVLEPGALETMLAAGADARTGAVAPRLLLPGGATQHSVHPLPTLPLTLAFNLGLHHTSRRLADRLCLEGHWDSERARVVPWAIGACLLLRREAFEEVGGFDEHQWLYAEDLDLGWRLHHRGWATRYEPQARVRHIGGAATRTVFGEDSTEAKMAATYAMLSRRRGILRMWLTAAINIAGAGIRVAWTAPLALAGGHRRAAASQSRRWLRAHLHGVRRLPVTASRP